MSGHRRCLSEEDEHFFSDLNDINSNEYDLFILVLVMAMVFLYKSFY